MHRKKKRRAKKKRIKKEVNPPHTEKFLEFKLFLSFVVLSVIACILIGYFYYRDYETYNKSPDDIRVIVTKKDCRRRGHRNRNNSRIVFEYEGKEHSISISEGECRNISLRSIIQVYHIDKYENSFQLRKPKKGPLVLTLILFCSSCFFIFKSIKAYKLEK